MNTRDAAKGGGRSSHLRVQIAQEAARLMVEHGIRDYGIAKRKAMMRICGTLRGGARRRDLPTNAEIEAARRGHQQIFHPDAQPDWARAMHSVAEDALKLLTGFHPCVVGPVIDGSADAHSEVNVHTFAEPPEQVGDLLRSHGIRAALGERRFRYPSAGSSITPVLRYHVGDVPVEVAIFPLRCRHQPPLSPLDGRPLLRLAPRQWQRVLDDPGRT